MDQPFLGTIVPMAINFAPYGWMTCQGQILPISQYTALFSLLGVNFGGNGTSNFGLPDLQGRMLIGQGMGPGLPDYVVGELGGAQTHTMITAEMPVHNHAITVKANGLSASSNDPNGNFFGGGGPNVYESSWDGSSYMNTQCVTEMVAGSGLPINILNPYLGLTYNIAYAGIFPSRN